MKNRVKLMAPAGSFESLAAAIQAGADAVYFGIGQLNMRANAAPNFTLEDLPEIVNRCKEKNVKTYLALNIVMYDSDLAEMQTICNQAKEAGITAVIASDVAVLKYANSIGLTVHISTQANVCNLEAVKFYAQFAEVIVLARELSLDQIRFIIEEIKKQKIKGPSGNLVKIELFIHGALCVAISGKCYMSFAQYGFSANRGQCLQACRRAYLLKDTETGEELKVENKFIMSPKDLCTITILDQILSSGVEVLKIEGRGRSVDYVYTTVKVYQEAIDSYFQGKYTLDKIANWKKELETVFNRGFWEGGYYLGQKLGEWSGLYGSKATIQKIYVGVARNYFDQAKVAEFYLETGEIKLGDNIIITGPTTGVVKAKVESLFVEVQAVKSAGKGDVVTIALSEKVRPRDKLFVLKERRIDSCG